MSSTTTITFILNPVSGTVKKAGIPDLISAKLDQSRFCHRIVWTEYAGHASEIAREERDLGTDIVVAVGGDGTVNEVGRSLIGSSTALAIIPCGSGNGLARHGRYGFICDDTVMIFFEKRIIEPCTGHPVHRADTPNNYADAPAEEREEERSEYQQSQGIRIPCLR